MKRTWSIIIAITCLLLTHLRAAENWPAWRGIDGFGSVTNGSYPLAIDLAKPKWKTSLPGKASSTPVVLEQRIYLSSPANGSNALLALDWNGNQIWQTTFDKDSGGKHRNGSGSNPSPVTDGDALYVYFKTGTLASVDKQGAILWQTNLITAFGPETLYWDQGTSPVLTKQDVVVVRMHEGESWVAAFDKKSGKMRWKVLRNYETAVEGDHSYATPAVCNYNGQQVLILWGAEHVTAHDPSDGKQLWACGDFNPQKASNWPTVASPVVVLDTVVVPFGRADRGQPRLYGVRMGGSGDVTSTHKAWTRDDTGSFVPTPAVYKDRLYVLGDRGDLQCIEPSTGKTVWQKALPKGSANFYSSPLIANGILYAIREDGGMFIARVEPEFALLQELKLGERVIASPIAVANRLLIRGDKTITCFAVE